jgi:hypothetical protein
VVHWPVHASRTLRADDCGGEDCCEEWERVVGARIERVIRREERAFERKWRGCIEAPRDRV